ncbi:MAG: murein biosynthesis integral membrane protein MurJ [Rhodospirillales bacterium]|nr:murein biosynthesis integral membrane protein MurJ [Rhodospirillales bacterium]
MTGARRGNLLRTGASVASLAAGGRVLGYGRNVAVAATLGAGPVADAFFLAFRAAVLLRGLFGGRGVGAAFIPMFTRLLSGGDPERARHFAGQALCLAAAALTVLVALGELAAPLLARALAPGYGDGSGDGADRLALTVLLVRIMLPFVLFAALAQLLGGVLNGLGRFAAAAALPALFNAVAIAALLILGEGLETPAHALAWGVAAAGAVQLAWVWLACQRTGFAPPLRRPRVTRWIRRLLRRAAPAAVGVGAEQAVVLIDLALASLLAAGAVSWLHYAERVARLVPSVAGMAAATVLLPHLARRRPGADRKDRSRADTSRALEAALLLSLPAAAALAVIGEPLLAALFQRGAFNADAAAAAAAALAAYAGAVPAWMAVPVLAAACFARGNTVSPMLAALAAVALNLALSLALMDPLGHAGIALGTTLAVWLQALGLWAALAWRGGFAPDARLRRRAPAIAAASLAMAGALWAARLALGAPGTSELERAAVLAVLIAAGLATFVLAARLFGAAQPGELVRAWRAGGRNSGDGA